MVAGWELHGMARIGQLRSQVHHPDLSAQEYPCCECIICTIYIRSCAPVGICDEMKVFFFLYLLGDKGVLR